MPTIPIFDLTRQHQHLAVSLNAAFERVLQRGVFVLGEEGVAFEQAFARYLGVSHTIGVASGTDALSLALLAVGVQPGDEVILPANSYPSVFGVTATGAIPRLVDSDPATFTMNPELLPNAITKKTKAIIPVHLYGQSADMDRILAIARRENIPVIEDCAQAAGAEISCHSEPVGLVKNPARLQNQPAGSFDSLQSLRMTTKKVGSLGDLACFSFYPTKNIGCLGDGGMVVTNNPDLAKRVRMLRMYGEEHRYRSMMVGRNSRLDELQAAFLSAKLPYLDGWNARRKQIAKQYTADVPHHVAAPHTSQHADSVYHLYIIRTRQRERLKAHLEKNGIGTGIHYPTPIHLTPSMAYLGYKKGDFPESERASDEVLSLPIYPELTDTEVQTVIAALSQFPSV